jgi:hypothetical protein
MPSEAATTRRAVAGRHRMLSCVVKKNRVGRWLRWLPLFVAASSASPAHAQSSPASSAATIPRTWDERALGDLEVPLARAAQSPRDISADEYYRLPVRPIYQDYPRYDPDHEPKGYRASLRRREPVVVWDDRGRRPPLASRADWIKAGALVFNAPVVYIAEDDDDPEHARQYIARTGDRFDRHGISPYSTYVVRTRGRLEVGEASCRECHSRLLPDGTVIRGAQGNRAMGPIVFYGLGDDFRGAPDRAQFMADLCKSLRREFAAPWLEAADPAASACALSAAQVEALYSAIPAGVFPRQGTSPFWPAKLPDLIGVKDQKFLDATGLQRNRGPADLMRYAALNQGMDLLAHFGSFVPAEAADGHPLPKEHRSRSRYSDEQLYALALYVDSLEPPPNPNRKSALTRRGEQVFEREQCGLCHPAPLYTSNELTPAAGFRTPADAGPEVLPIVVGTDPTSTLGERRGTGYYKIPSLRGVWYRGPFEHNGSVATLEDWFDPRRLRDDYVPTGWKGYRRQTRAVVGHEYGLELSAADKRALIAFLKTL